MATLLIDHDVAFSRDWFGGLVADGRRTDSEITTEAWNTLKTAVTANGSVFVRAFLNHHRRHPCTKSGCHDLNGLIVIPNHEFRARNALVAADKLRSLRLGRSPLTWDDVHEYNLYAKYHADGTVDLKRFPLCRYRNDEMPEWYSTLRQVGGGKA